MRLGTTITMMTTGVFAYSLKYANLSVGEKYMNNDTNLCLKVQMKKLRLLIKVYLNL